MIAEEVSLGKDFVPGVAKLVSGTWPNIAAQVLVIGDLPVAVDVWEFSHVASIVDFAIPERHSEDGKDHEEEHCQPHDASELLHRLEQRANQQLHARH